MPLDTLTARDHARHRSSVTPIPCQNWPYRDPVSAEPAQLRLIADLIRRGRTARGWSQGYLADKIGVSVPTIKRYESAKSPKPDIYHLISIFKTLDLPRRELAAAIGILSRDELDLPATPARILSKRSEELIELIEDPNISDDEKDAYLEVLRARRRTHQRQARTGTSDTRRAG